MNKKGFFFIFLLFFVALFLDGFSSNCKAVTLDDYQLTDEIMEDIVDEVGLSNYYSGDYIPLLTNNFNTMMRTIRARGDGHLVTLKDCVFTGTYTGTVSVTCLQVAFINWRDNDNDQRAFYENNHTPLVNLYGQQQEGGTITGTLGVADWKGWTYDSNNNITGYTTGYLPHWRITQTSTTFVNNANLQIYQPTFTRITSGDISINKMIVLDNSSIDNDGYVMYAARTYQWGYGFYIYSHVLYLDNYGSISTPTPTPTPTGGGGGIVISGGMTQQEFEQGQENYWGNSGDLNGVDQEDDISDSIDNLVQSASGELAQNEIFGALSDFEQGFFNLFVERDPLLLDLKVSWPNIYSLADGNEEFLIESGEINFSEMCRNNETLGNIQDVVRVIFNFYFGVSLLVYLYNLVLSTLGIDNPFLYDNPENGYEDIVYDINTGTETSYVHKTYPNSFRRHQTLIWRRK